MYEQTELHKANINLSKQKRKLERLDEEVVAQRQKVREIKDLVKKLAKEAR